MHISFVVLDLSHFHVLANIVEPPWTPSHPGAAARAAPALFPVKQTNPSDGIQNSTPAIRRTEGSDERK